ncbi:Myosin heavy chain, non-muscle [Papilio xuthus]|uniref:Myosin heavy chain, non-muscle n=1 Tax=Papilio xuthus TaxID=66420 RepID=A0A194PZQ6_PAPXU|nr:Myosin heavy chain, non-muscle [Papilio xuthus]
MPAVKVFSIFGGQKPTEKHTAPTAQNRAMQKLYRTFSVGPQNTNELKGGKVTAIAACIEKRIVSEPQVKNNSDNVQNNSNITDIKVHSSADISDVSKRQRVYENVNIVNVDKKRDVKDKLLEESKGYTSVYENITVVNIQQKDKIESDRRAESKLNKALESFDKILSEFTSSTSLSDINSNSAFIVPKLQKSKTCSIIESRCILKKSKSDPESDTKLRKKVSRNKSIDKTTSLWNLDDMKGKELSSPIMPLSSIQNDKINSDKYATYKISSKPTSRANCIKTEDLKKLDVKTRILKKTLSNPPSTPVPVVTKTKQSPKKLNDPKKIRSKILPDKTKPSIDSKDMPKSQMQKAKSVWEIGNEAMISTKLERTKSTTSIAGSPSKIPVIRSQMSQNKFSSTRALFSPTPVDLNNVDQARECAQKNKATAARKSLEKFEPKQIKQKSQLNLKTDSKRQCDKTKKEIVDKKLSSSPKSSIRDYSDEINAMRAKFQQKKINNKRDLVVVLPETKRNENEPEAIETLSPVKYIVKKLEYKTAMESKADAAQFLSCKVIPAIHKEECVANTTFHNHLSTLVGRQVKYIEPRDDTKTCSQIEKIDLHKHAMEKISDTHSDCSDDSGHVSNDAGNDNDTVFDNIHDLNGSVDEVDCKIFDGPKQFGIDVPEHAKNVCPVRPARRGGGRTNEVASGTPADAPKVDEQIMFRGGVVGGLDARRDAALARVLVRLQARARGLLARRRAQRLRTQHTAARCVQRNVRAFLAVRDWPWWRLLVRVTPLLAVHRTEHRLKQAQVQCSIILGAFGKV